MCVLSIHTYMLKKSINTITFLPVKKLAISFKTILVLYIFLFFYYFMIIMRIPHLVFLPFYIFVTLYFVVSLLHVTSTHNSDNNRLCIITINLPKP